MMKRLKALLESHQIAILVISSILFTITIHLAFYIPAPIDWMEAKWEAGDILTYVSTVALGILALWQNNRFKNENDISQQRMELLTVQANELSLINRIIESETHRIQEFKKAEEAFYYHCDIQNITVLYHNNKASDLDLRTAISQFDTQLNESFFNLFRSLSNDPFVKTDDLKRISTIFYSHAKQLLFKLSDNTQAADIKTECDKLQEIRLDFIEARGKYYMLVDAKYQKLIYGNMTLSEIKKEYQINNMEE